MTETDSPLKLEFGSMELIWNLACLREAASAKAGAWYLVLLLSLCPMLFKDLYRVHEFIGLIVSPF
jgi:hypothetical protein